MTLEDFFTLSELKDGLTSPDRVMDLITVMQRENDSVVKNFAEATRQWSTVATTVAATENKNCLDLFIDLNGLYFIDRWLKEAQMLGNDTGNGFLEESIVALLRALERLQIHNQRSPVFGIARTVQNLVDHHSSVVRDRAKALCDQWMLIQDGDVARRDVENPDDDNDEKNVETMPLVTDTIQSAPDKITDQEPLDHVDPWCKSPHDDTLSSRLEQIPSSADVDNVLDSSTKTDPRGDEDEEMVDDGESLDRFPTTMPLKNTKAESLKTSSHPQSERDANARDDGVKSDILDMECGMIDPMEVARRVSIEVRREVDSRERSCSTSEKTSSGGSERPHTPDSTNRKESPPIDGSDKEATSGSEKTLSGGAAEPVKDAETLVSEREICKTDITASQISEIAQESEANTGFDLNQEVCSEEVDNPINPVSSTISVVSASRAVPTSGLPAAPLQFEGTLGWKGSASTSAFRRVSDSFSTHNNSKQRLDCLDIDLNMTEGNDDKIEDFLSRNKIPIVTGLPSGEESFVEASPRRPERMQFDLNSISDEIADAVGFDSRRDRRVASINQNGRQSPSRSSSSSSKQPSLRNIDLNLNDQPVFPYGKQDESVISIFGTELEVKNTKDSIPQPSGRILEPPVDFNFGRSGSISYGNPPFYGPNGFSSGATAMFFYGSPGVPIPYMVDSRGAHVGPQISGSGQPPSPFIPNMAAAGSSSGSSGMGPMLHNFDLNTGLVIDGGNRNPIGGCIDEQFSRVNKSLQGSSSCVVGEKRREPDAARWELFPINKHPQPPPQPPWR